MPMKPLKLVWVLADSHNGYFSRFHVYTGKQDGVVEDLGAHVVKDLTSNLTGRYFHVCFDNFFTNTELLTDLEWDGIYSCGTTRRNRRGSPRH